MPRGRLFLLRRKRETQGGAPCVAESSFLPSGDGRDDEQREHDVHEGAREQRAVDAVEDAAVGGHELAHVFDAEAALDDAFDEVAEDGHQRGEQADDGEHHPGRARPGAADARIDVVGGERVQPIEQHARARAGDDAADDARDRLVGADGGAEFGAVEDAAHRKGEGIRRGRDDVDEQQPEGGADGQLVHEQHGREHRRRVDAGEQRRARARERRVAVVEHQKAEQREGEHKGEHEQPAVALAVCQRYQLFTRKPEPVILVGDVVQSAVLTLVNTVLPSPGSDSLMP